MKTVTIDELLSWAFVHELPKGGGVEGLANLNSAWRMIADYGTRISTGAVGGGGNYFIEQGDPSDDALAVGDAVNALRSVDIVLPEGWNPLGDWPDTNGLAALAVEQVADRYQLRGSQRRSEGLTALVIGVAILGREPDWSAEPPKLRMVERNGKPAWFVVRQMTNTLGDSFDYEQDGFNRRSGRPMRGAYRKFEFASDPAGDILARLDWQVWVAALRHLEGALADRLVGHRLRPCERSMTPWIAEDGGGVRLTAGGFQAAARMSN